MRKIVLQMMTTLNGRLDDPYAWLPGVGDDLYADINAIAAGFDCYLVGHVTYAEMFAYWPGAEHEAGGTESNRQMARSMNTRKKYVLSRSGQRGPLEWNNSELVPAPTDADLVAFATDLKSQPGGDIHLTGGASLARKMIALDLVDDYRFFVHPVVSKGEEWFGEIVGNRAIELVEAKSYQLGVVGLHYVSKGNVPVGEARESFTEMLV